MRTRELLHLENTGHAGMNALFAKAHSADWDIENDVDWSTPVDPDEPLVDHQWTAFSKTPTFQSLSEQVKNYVTRRGVGRILNVLQVGESVAQDVCAKIALGVRQEDYRNHAVAQAMDEARHHMAYRRFIEKMGEEVEDIDPMVEMMFDSLLSAKDPLRLIASEQFFLESLAMGIFESLQTHATNPLLKNIITLITRDESRHIGFGILYVEEWMKQHSLDEQISFSRHWLGEILTSLMDQPGPVMARRLAQRLSEAGIDNAGELAKRMLGEQQEVNQREADDAISGRRIPHLLTSARRAGMLKPEILEGLGLQDNLLIQGALRGSQASI